MPSSEFSPDNPRIPPVSQMLLELHLWNREFSDLLKWWSTLERAGFRAVTREPNLVYQNYNRMQGAELAEVRLVANYWNVFINRQDSTHSSTCQVEGFHIRRCSDTNSVLNSFAGATARTYGISSRIRDLRHVGKT